MWALSVMMVVLVLQSIAVVEAVNFYVDILSHFDRTTPRTSISVNINSPIEGPLALHGQICRALIRENKLPRRSIANSGKDSFLCPWKLTVGRIKASDGQQDYVWDFELPKLVEEAKSSPTLLTVLKAEIELPVVGLGIEGGNYNPVHNVKVYRTIYHTDRQLAKTLAHSVGAAETDCCWKLPAAALQDDPQIREDTRLKEDSQLFALQMSDTVYARRHVRHKSSDDIVFQVEFAWDPHQEAQFTVTKGANKLHHNAEMVRQLEHQISTFLCKKHRATQRSKGNSVAINESGVHHSECSWNIQLAWYDSTADAEPLRVADDRELMRYHPTAGGSHGNSGNRLVVQGAYKGLRVVGIDQDGKKKETTTPNFFATDKDIAASLAHMVGAAEGGCCWEEESDVLSGKEPTANADDYFMQLKANEGDLESRPQLFARRGQN